MLRELKMYMLTQIKYIALNLLLFYEEHIDTKHPVYKSGLATEYIYMKNCINNIEKCLSETVDKS